MPEVDMRIVEALRRDGRISTHELADHLGLSRTTTARRLSHLLDGGIVSVVGLVHPLTIGIKSLAHISISVDKPVRRVADAIAAMPEVPFVSLVSGAFPLIAEARAYGDGDLAAVLDRVRSVDGVRSTETLFYTELVVDVLRPTRADAVEIDHVDSRLLMQLQIDGRLSYTTLGERVGVSTGTARTRVLRMIDEGVVRIGAIARPGRRDTEFDVGVGISLRGPASAGGDLLSEMPEIRFLAATLGRYDLLATVHADSLASIVSVLDRLRALRPVLRLDSWVHLDTVKESYHYPVEAINP
jgi:DNA-binding Lrp family transcriptional regulator